MQTAVNRIAIIGGGPIGLEAALAAVHAGCKVRLYEQRSIAEHVRNWGHIQMFSPFGMNSSLLGRARLATECPNLTLPDANALLTGREYYERYLLPLSQLPELKGKLHEQVEVVTVGRLDCWKADLVGSSERAIFPFVLVLNKHSGDERRVDADVVLDCSGTFQQHNWLGAGGIPAVGELASENYIEYRLPDLLNKNKEAYIGKKTLVVGSGYSAACAVVALAQLAEADSKTSVVWLTRRKAELPIEPIENDELKNRRELTEQANRFATTRKNFVQWRPEIMVHSIWYKPHDQHFYIGLRSLNTEIPQATGSNETTDLLIVDRVIANVGFRPNRKIYEELQVHECYASGGPIKLATQLLGKDSIDCLNQPFSDADLLSNPEPDFYILGAKSYGRNSRFLIQTGIQQVAEIIQKVSDND